MKVLDATNEHPMAVPISVTLANHKDTESSPGDKIAERKGDFLLSPDFKAPTAVAGSSSSAVVGGSGEHCDGGGDPEPRLVYSKDHSESLTPCWAVQRITNDALKQEREQILKEMKTTGEKQKLPQVNSQTVTCVHKCLAMDGVGEQPLTSTRWITVPYITNSKDLEEGDELIVQHVPRVQKHKRDKRKTHWKYAQKDLDKKGQKLAEGKGNGKGKKVKG